MTVPQQPQPQGACISESLRWNFSWTIAGDVIYAACQWGMLITLAKLGSPEMVGQFALGLAVTAPVIIFANLALRPIQSTDVRSEFKFGDYLALRLLTTGMALLVIVGIVFIVGYRREAVLVILALGLAKAIEAISEIYYGLLQRHERMEFIAKSKILKGPLSLMCLTIGVWSTGSVHWGAIGLIVAWVPVLIGYDIRNVAKILNGSGPAAIQPIWDFGTLGRLAWLALPLGVALLFISLNDTVPRYFIERFEGEGPLGIFAAMAYLMVAEGMIVNALGQSVSPQLAKYWVENSIPTFRALLLKIVALASLIGAGGVTVALVAGPELLHLVYGPEYAAQSDVLVWLMVAAAIANLASVLGYAMTAARLIRIQSIQLACTTITGAICCALLIPPHGLNGAAWAIGLALLMQVAFAIMCLLYALRCRLKNGTVEAESPLVRCV
jgi:O-antigen/teichoic acid export membrane protein